ncbi:MAG TPA: Flp family type IVb pilin [Candidatus Cybelea sp.]|nr:Flp family type IVb pilin [Candidatus Cybelea sp.]
MFTTLCAIARNLRRDEEGATMVEYGLLVALIAMVALAGVSLLGVNLQTLYTTVAGSV